MVEVVIAMAVIAVITVTALTIVTTSNDNTIDAMYKADAQYIIYDALECFKTSRNHDEFADALVFRGNLTKQSSDIVSPPLPIAELDAEPDQGGSGDDAEPDQGESGGSGNPEDPGVAPNPQIAQYFMINDSHYIVCVTLQYGIGVQTPDGFPTLDTRDTFSIYVLNTDNEVIASITDYQKINRGGNQ